VIEPPVCVGAGTRIWHWTQVRPGAIIGKDCVIGSRVEIGPGVEIGDGTHIGASAQLHHPARVGKHVFVAPMVFLSNDKYPSLVSDFKPRGVTIEDHAIIGAGAQIIGGVTIGEGAFVALGALVTKDVPSGSMVKGRPAREYARRGMHYPGGALEHWGPLCRDERCLRCDAEGLEQYEALMDRAEIEGGA